MKAYIKVFLQKEDGFHTVELVLLLTVLIFLIVILQQNSIIWFDSAADNFDPEVPTFHRALDFHHHFYRTVVYR